MNNYSRGFRIVFLFILGVSLAGGGKVNAAPQEVTITVNTLGEELVVNGNCSLREAIFSANYNGPIDACTGGSSTEMDKIVFSVSGTIVLTYILPAVVNAGPLTIDGGSVVIVSGNNTTPIMQVESDANLTLRNLTLTAGRLTGTEVGGAGLFNNGGTVTIDNCNFLGNTGSGIAGGEESMFGGAIYNKDGSLTISNSNFHNNSLNVDLSFGGAIYNWRGTLTITGSTFQNNSTGGSTSYGGAIISGDTGSTLYINSTNFYNNSSQDYGGAIFTVGVTDVSDCTFQGNATIQSGGAIYHRYFMISYPLTISNSTFDGNVSVGDGGAIFTENECSVEDSNFTGNSALKSGGAIYSSSGIHTLHLDGNVFQENAALDAGGGVALRVDDDFNISNNTFEGNSAGNGGGVYIFQSIGSISDSLFRQNYADKGGGIFNTASTLTESAVKLERTTLWENNCEHNGGAVYNENAHLMMINDTLGYNSAGNGGGAMGNVSGFVEILNTTMAYNSATYNGDQLYNMLFYEGPIYTSNSIYAHGGNGKNCFGTITDYGNNMDSGNTCGFNIASGSMIDTDPILGPLGDDDAPEFLHTPQQGENNLDPPGYPVLTFPLLYPSPAVNHGNSSLCPSTDQREQPRREGFCDIGSYQSQAYVFYTNRGDGQSTYVNTYFPERLVMEVQDMYGNRLAGVPVTYTGPASGASIANNNTRLVTEADGFARLNALANSVPGGPYNVVAADQAGSISTTFHLTNLAQAKPEKRLFIPLALK